MIYEYLNGPREFVICAAVLAADGSVVYCHRHCDGLATIARMGKERMKGPGAQGFVTSSRRYVDRLEGQRVQIEAGIRSKADGGYVGGLLYSEDLY